MPETTATNPFNSTRPGNLFVGYEALRRRIVTGLSNGNSFALLGGRRCGKTSLLLQLEADLRCESKGGRTPLPRHWDIQSEIPRSPTDFFQSISHRLVDGTAIPPWDGSTRGRQPYQSFIAHLNAIEAQLNQAHGRDWLCVLLVDELEVSGKYLEGDECFHNLRHLLKRSEFATRLAVVIAGSTGLGDLTKAGSPLSNILELETLAVLSRSEACRLMRYGRNGSAVNETVSAMEEQLLTLTGGHPWMLQALMEQLWDQDDSLSDEGVTVAVRRFVRNRDDVFATWIQAMGQAGQDAFSALARSGVSGLSQEELRSLVPPGASNRVLKVLEYHGIVAEEADQRARPNGTIFRDWFLQNVNYVEPDPTLQPVQATRLTAKQDVRKRVFVVFGRDRKLHSAVIRFLRCLRLEPVEWNAALEATQNGAATVKDILERALEMAQAVVVLLTPDDEARLRTTFHGAQEPTHEKNFTPQPRPNVIFEAGFALAKFPTRTILVRFDKSTRLFSDIGGVFLLDLTNELHARQDFVRRLRTVGLDIDDTGTEWQTKECGGDFTPAA